MPAPSNFPPIQLFWLMLVSYSPSQKSRIELLELQTNFWVKSSLAAKFSRFITFLLFVTKNVRLDTLLGKEKFYFLMKDLFNMQFQFMFLSRDHELLDICGLSCRPVNFHERIWIYFGKFVQTAQNACEIALVDMLNESCIELKWSKVFEGRGLLGCISAYEIGRTCWSHTDLGPFPMNWNRTELCGPKLSPLIN